MRTAAIPLQFDVNDALDRLKEVSSGQPGTIAIEIPDAIVRVRITE